MTDESPACAGVTASDSAQSNDGGSVNACHFDELVGGLKGRKPALLLRLKNCTIVIGHTAPNPIFPSYAAHYEYAL
jgi:hypothetical protein